MKKTERHALAQLTTRARAALDILISFEIDVFAHPDQLAQYLEQDPITFAVFACLGTKRGTEELKLDVHETIFFRRNAKRARQLFQSMSSHGVEARLIVILPDLEPIRTWGWSVPQEELTGFCQMMAEDAAPSLPKVWDIVCWSDLEQEDACDMTYDNALDWATNCAHPIILREETTFFKELSKRHPNILTRRNARDMALRQIAAYAYEGMILEKLFPYAILLQSDVPIKRKDAMFGPLRESGLPIVHPFS